MATVALESSNPDMTQQQQPCSDLVSCGIALLNDPNHTQLEREKKNDGKLSRLFGCGEQLTRYNVLKYCFEGYSAFAGLSEIIMGYYWPHSPLPKNLYPQGIVGPTQQDAARWISGRDLHLTRNWMPRNIKKSEKEKQLEMNGCAIAKIPFAADWEEKLVRGQQIFPYICKKYCHDRALSVGGISPAWIVPVYGPDGTVESLMSNHCNGCVFVTNSSGLVIELPHHGKVSFEIPDRVLRVQNPDLPAETIFVLLHCQHRDRVAIIWDENIAPTPNRHYKKNRWIMDAGDTFLHFNRYAIAISNDFVIIKPSMRVKSVVLFHYWFCHQSKKMKIEGLTFDGGDLGRYMKGLRKAYADGGLETSVAGSTLYTWWHRCNHLMSWDISIQSFRQHKFAQALGVHFLWVDPDDCDTHLSHLYSISEIDDGMMLLHDACKHPDGTEFQVFGPNPKTSMGEPKDL